MEAPGAPSTAAVPEEGGPPEGTTSPPAAAAAAQATKEPAAAATTCEAFVRLPGEETALINGDIKEALEKWYVTKGCREKRDCPVGRWKGPRQRDRQKETEIGDRETDRKRQR